MSTLINEVEAHAAERLVLAEGQTPAAELVRYKRFLKDEAARLKKLHRGGGLGREVCHARAAVIDALIRHLIDTAIGLAPLGKFKSPPAIAVVAIGGYGRAELNPQSDIDILFLCDDRLLAKPKPEEFLQSVTDTVLYTLWDVGLKIGHSVRRVRDCVEEANKDMQSKTALIESRRVAGDESLFKKMEHAVHTKCVKPHVADYIVARLEDQAGRRAKHGNAVTMQEPNIKNGCGGLRDYQNLHWMMHFREGSRMMEDLEARQVVTKAEAERLEAAYSFLLRARNELHYQMDRPVEVLTKAVQPKVAWQLGYTNRSPAKRLEAFMGDYYKHARHIDLTVRAIEQRLALVPRPAWQQALGRWVSGRKEQVIDGFTIEDGAINTTNRRVFRDQPRKLMRVFLLMQRHSLRLHPDLAQIIRQQVWLVDRAFREDPHVHETFLEILNHPGAVGRILRRMHELDLLGKFLPEFGRLTCLVQHEFYHQYTVDEHTLVCLEKLDGLWEETWPDYRRYHEVFEEIERPSTLYLALLLHDSGKGIESDRHEREGARVAEHVADRIGLDEVAADSLQLIIRHHLTMVQVAQRRDLEDPQVVEQFAEEMETEENLNLLMLHTLADSLGTSDDLWNGFKDTSQWSLFWKTRALFREGPVAVRAEEEERAEIEAEVTKLLGAQVPAEEITAHFEQLPMRYFRALPADEIAEDIGLVHKFIRLQITFDDRMLEPAVEWQRDRDRGYAVASICTWDRPGLFSRITGVLAQCGLNILSAQIFTRGDSMVLDHFHLTDARTGQLPTGEQRAQFTERLKPALAAHEDPDLDLGELPDSGIEYTSLTGEHIPTAIHFDNRSSAEFTVLDLEAEDHVGLLYAVTHTLNALGLTIELARINTEKGGANDSFYLTDIDGGKVEDESRQQFITAMLRHVIAALHEA
ncbi:MAG: [protein-PII] uridylyltransferase [Verrucomicrobiales bacterium]|nr:[protein-PII] uridylyltransferase [Verrucomicrobiales bacterium]